MRKGARVRERKRCSRVARNSHRDFDPGVEGGGDDRVVAAVRQPDAADTLRVDLGVARVAVGAGDEDVDLVGDDLGSTEAEGAPEAKKQRAKVAA